MARRTNPNAVPPISQTWLRLFTFVVRMYFRRHFRAVLMQHGDRLRNATGPLIVYGNHPSWWDPMTAILLAQTLLPHRRHYAPMDATPLARYPFLQRVGIFPVEAGTLHGTIQFLQTAQAILESDGVLWLTPQGRFADVREQPLAFKGGLAALMKRVPQAAALPVATEYVFWNERLPETLIRFAQPLTWVADRSKHATTARMEAALSEVMAELKMAAITRDPSLFEVLLEGSRGTGGFYALGRCFRNLLRGKGFVEDRSARDSVTGNRGK